MCSERISKRKGLLEFSSKVRALEGKGRANIHQSGGESKCGPAFWCAGRAQGRLEALRAGEKWSSRASSPQWSARFKRLMMDRCGSIAIERR